MESAKSIPRVMGRDVNAKERERERETVLEKSVTLPSNEKTQ